MALRCLSAGLRREEGFFPFAYPALRRRMRLPRAGLDCSAPFRGFGVGALKSRVANRKLQLAMKMQSEKRRGFW